MLILFFYMKQKMMAFLYQNSFGTPIAKNSREYISPLMLIIQIETHQFVSQSSLENPVIGDNWSWN